MGYVLYAYIFLSYTLTALANGKGLLLLYRPRDVSNECAFSRTLRYDISFGMGMSDTITLVFRSLSEGDYECTIDIVTEAWATIVAVVKYPTTLGVNCNANKDAIMILKKNVCLRLCDYLAERNLLSSYFVTTMNGRMRFRFLSNSSINSDINANIYQVTATSARLRVDEEQCNGKNESVCIVKDKKYCFTSGVVCDGINNCGVADWFDERKDECGVLVETLGLAPVIAVVAAVLCAALAAGHTLLRCLPPLANSFFIYNANEDNRLCIDPLLKISGQRPQSMEKVKRTSLIPVFLSSSSDSTSSNKDNEDVLVSPEVLRMVNNEIDPSSKREVKTEEPKSLTTNEPASIPQKETSRIRSMAERFQNKFRKEKNQKHTPDFEIL